MKMCILPRLDPRSCLLNRVFATRVKRMTLEGLLSSFRTYQFRCISTSTAIFDLPVVTLEENPLKYSFASRLRFADQDMLLCFADQDARH